MLPGFDPKRASALLFVKIRERGLTLRDVSRHLDWPQDKISRMFKGIVKMRLEQVYEILSVLGVPPMEFFSELHGPSWTPSSLADVDLSDLDPNQILVGKLTFGKLLAEVRRAVREELEADREKDVHTAGTENTTTAERRGLAPLSPKRSVLLPRTKRTFTARS
jgi:hypothetical protein